MSYDLAVWEGAAPAGDAAADARFAELVEGLEGGDDTEPTETIRAFVFRLTERYPMSGHGTPDGAADTSPWATEPLLDSAFGPNVYVTITYAAAAEVAPFCVDTARDLGLVVYDPQQECVL